MIKRDKLQNCGTFYQSAILLKRLDLPGLLLVTFTAKQGSEQNAEPLPALQAERQECGPCPPLLSSCRLRPSSCTCSCSTCCSSSCRSVSCTSPILSSFSPFRRSNARPAEAEQRRSGGQFLLRSVRRGEARRGAARRRTGARTCDGVLGEGLHVGQVVVRTVFLQPFTDVLL